MLVEKGVNEELLKSKVVYSLTCKSARELGGECVKKGADCFIGYADDFAAWLETSRMATPLRDQTAKAFFEPASAIPIELIKGKTAKEAYIKSQKMFDQEISYYSSTAAPHGTQAFPPLLLWNKQQQTLLGNPNAKIT